MSVRLAVDEYRQVAALYCSTTGYAFGPVLTGRDAEDQANEFIAHVEKTEGEDIRRVSGKRLDELHTEFVRYWEIAA